MKKFVDKSVAAIRIEISAHRTIKDAATFIRCVLVDETGINTISPFLWHEKNCHAPAVGRDGGVLPQKSLSRGELHVLADPPRSLARLLDAPTE